MLQFTVLSFTFEHSVTVSSGLVVVHQSFPACLIIFGIYLILLMNK